MSAHKGQMPEEAWQKRKQEWTPEVSAAAWLRTIRAIADDPQSQDCVYVAVDESQDEIVGLVMGGPGDAERLPNCGEIYALYVRPEHHGRGVGRRLLQVAVRFFIAHGKTTLMIGCLNSNTPAAGFYTAMGGHIIGTRDGDEYGHKITVDIYGWQAISSFSLD